MEDGKPLVIFDMNGIFTDREFVVFKTEGLGSLRDFKGQLPNGVPGNATRLGKFLVWKRPGLEEFVSFVFEHYRVAVWSSVSKVNLDQLCNFVFGTNVSRLEFIFDQSDCDQVSESIAPDIGEQRKDKSTKKPIFLKNLTKVWGRYPQFNEENTIIVDDSDHKMINNPKTCHFNPGTWTRDKVDDNGLKVGGLLRNFLQSRVPVSWDILAFEHNIHEQQLREICTNLGAILLDCEVTPAFRYVVRASRDQMQHIAIMIPWIKQYHRSDIRFEECDLNEAQM